MTKNTTILLVFLFFAALFMWTLPAGEFPVYMGSMHCELEVWSIGKALFCRGAYLTLYLALFPFLVPVIFLLGRFGWIPIVACFTAGTLGLLAFVAGLAWDFWVSFNVFASLFGLPAGELCIISYLYVGILVAMGVVFWWRGRALLKARRTAANVPLPEG